MLRFLPKEILEIPDSQFQVPLVHAVQANNLDICQILIQGGANVNSVDQTTGRTPLHFAAEAAYGPMTELLLRSGGLLDIPDADRLTPIHIASIVDSQDALNTIVKVVGSEVLNLPEMMGLTDIHTTLCSEVCINFQPCIDSPFSFCICYYASHYNLQPSLRP